MSCQNELPERSTSHKISASTACIGALSQDLHVILSLSPAAGPWPFYRTACGNPALVVWPMTSSDISFWYLPYGVGPFAGPDPLAARGPSAGPYLRDTFAFGSAGPDLHLD